MSAVDFKSIFEALPTPYLVLDPDDRVVAMTHLVAERSAKPTTDLVGKSVRDLSGLPGFDSCLKSPVGAPVYAEDGSLAYSIFCCENSDQAFGPQPVRGGSDHKVHETRELCRGESLLVDQRRYFESLLRFLKKLDFTSTYDEILNTAREEIQSTIGFKTSWFYMLSEDQKYFELIAESDSGSGWNK